MSEQHQSYQPNTTLDPAGTSRASAPAAQTFTTIPIPENLKSNLELFLRLVRKVIREYDPALCTTFDTLLPDFIEADNQELLHSGQAS